MPAVYVHLAGEDIDEAHRVLNGLARSKIEEHNVKPRQGVSGPTLNSTDSKFCNRCGMPLDMETAVTMDEARKKIDQLLNRLTEDPKKLEKLLALIEG